MHIVTEFWKITLVGMPEIIRIFEYATILLTSQKYFYTFPCNSKHFYCIGILNKKKTQIFQAAFQN